MGNPTRSRKVSSDRWKVNLLRLKKRRKTKSGDLLDGGIRQRLTEKRKLVISWSLNLLFFILLKSFVYFHSKQTSSRAELQNLEIWRFCSNAQCKRSIEIVQAWQRQSSDFFLKLEATQLILSGFKSLRLYSSISMNTTMKYDIPSVLSEHSKFHFKVKSKDTKKGQYLLSYPRTQLLWWLTVGEQKNSQLCRF